MSLLTETKVNVAEYDNLKTQKYTLNQYSIVRDVYYYYLEGTCTPRGSGLTTFIDDRTGRPLSVQDTLMESLFISTDPAIVVDGNLLNMYFSVVVIFAEYADDPNNNNNSSWDTLGYSLTVSEVNSKFYNNLATSFNLVNYSPQPIVAFYASPSWGVVTDGTVHIKILCSTIF